MAGPWEKYAQQPAPQGPAMSAPQVIQGPPKVIDPAEQQRLEMERTRLGMSREADARAQNKFEDDERAQAARGGVDTTVDERLSAFLGGKLAFDLGSLNSVLKQHPDAASPTFTQKAAGTLGDDAKNLASGAGRQQVDAIQLGILESALTLATGAAYNKEQLIGQQRRYFPQLGDAPETIAEKQKALRFLLEAAKIRAGAAAPQIDQALAVFGQDEPSLPNQQLSQEQVNARVGEMLIQGKSRDEIAAFVKSTGREPSPEFLKGVDANIGNQRPDVRTDQPEMGDGMRKFMVGTGDVVQTIGDAVGLVANPLNTALNITGIPQAVTGEPLGTDFGQSLRDTLGFPRPRGSTEELVSKINRGAGMGLGFAGAARVAAPVTEGIVSNALTRFGSQPLVDTAAGGASSGAGEIARQRGAGPIGQMGASLAGGALAIAPASRANALLEGVPRIENALARAGKEERVTVNRAMADPRTENRVTGVESTAVGGPIVQREMRKVGSQIEGRVQGLGRGGQAMENNVAGEVVRGAAERFIKNSGKKFSALYRRAEQLAGGEKLDAPNANQVLDEVTARLSETGSTNSAELAYLAGLKKDLSKPVSVEALRDMRTTLRQKIAKGDLTFGANEKRVLDVMDALSQDIEGGLRAAGKERAAAAFKNADEGYRERMSFIQGTVQKIIGKRDANLSPEDVFRRFQAMTTPKGDQAGLAKMMRTMDPEEQADIAATFADALGKNRAGEFSTAQLVSQAQKLPPAARINLFGPEGAKSLDNLITLAKEHKRVVGQFNSSKTGRTSDYRSWLTNLLYGGGGGAGISVLTEGSVTGPALAGAAVTAAVKGGRDLLNARALMSTDITKWLSTAPKTASAEAINTHFNRLANIAARNPALAEEVAQIQQAIMRAANENLAKAGPAAASPEQGPDKADRGRK